MLYRFSLVLVWLGIVLAAVFLGLGLLAAFNARAAGAVLFVMFATGALISGAFTHAVAFILEPAAIGRVYKRQGRDSANRPISPTNSSPLPRPERFESESWSPGPSGIGGWLIPPAIRLVLGPFAVAAALVEVVPLLGQVNPTSTIAIFLLFETVANAALLIFGLKVAVDFFRKKRVAPSGFVTLLVVTLFVVVADFAIAVIIFDAEVIPEDWRNLFQASIACLIWIPYMLKSQRVRRTFVVD